MALITTLFSAFSTLDAVALACLLGAWGAIETAVHPRVFGDRSAGEMMSRWRERWFDMIAERDNRIVDSNLLNGLRTAMAFYISGSLLALGGAIAFIGQTDQLVMVAQNLTVVDQLDRASWIAKLLVVVAILAVAFLEFIWAHRILGYCAVVLGAIPNDPADPEAKAIAARGARLSNLATRHFNRGIRAVYFALTALAWLVGPTLLLLATVLTSWIMFRREFLSETRDAVRKR